MSTTKFFLIGLRGARQRNSKRVSRYRQAPQDVAEFFRQPSVIHIAQLEDFFSHEPEQLGGFLDEPNARVNESVLVVERGIDRSQRRLLVFVEIHRSPVRIARRPLRDRLSLIADSRICFGVGKIRNEIHQHENSAQEKNSTLNRRQIAP